MADSVSISSNASPHTSDNLELRPSSIDAKEAASLQVLLKLMLEFTPYIKGSFVLEKTWWEINAEKCGIHVRLPSILAAPPLIMILF